MNTKVKKSMKIAAAAVFILALALNVTMSLNNPFAMVNAEVLAQQTCTGSNCDSNLQRNFKSEPVWYNSEISGGVALSKKPSWWVSGTWVSIMCCVDGTDMDGCDFSLEDPNCASRVIRSSHT